MAKFWEKVRETYQVRAEDKPKKAISLATIRNYYKGRIERDFTKGLKAEQRDDYSYMLFIPCKSGEIYLHSETENLLGVFVKPTASGGKRNAHRAPLKNIGAQKVMDCQWEEKWILAAEKLDLACEIMGAYKTKKYTRKRGENVK